MNVLAGDIGGTKTLLALCDEQARILLYRRYASKAFPHFRDVVATFLEEAGARPERACFGVAGPVVDDRCQATNLPWVFDARALESELGIPKVALINDFQANALAIPHLAGKDFVEIHSGNPIPNGPLAVLGAGTGLGEAFLFAFGNRYEVVPSEGGHTDFAPTNDRQIELLRYLRETLGKRVSYERVLSGPGLYNIYRFLRDRGFGKERPDVAEAMAREDPAAVITRFARDGADPLCDITLDVFCEVYGQEAGNLALQILARGGVFICGGIAPRIVDRMRGERFSRAYCDKGRMSPIVAGIPVRVVMNPHAGLIGAAVAAVRL
ncbi:MAG: glucokinase [Deltaproteobacteria bacterium]|nr:MAG: glucokinase [Deltaproteobacteria bacterium]